MKNYPPLTQRDIRTLKGDPIAKRVNYAKNNSELPVEEWTYYNIRTNNKESYVFKNGKLAGYKNDGC